MRTLIVCIFACSYTVVFAQSNHFDQWDVRFGAPGVRHSLNFPEEIRSFAVSGQNIYIGGMFKDVNGSISNSLAVWDGRSMKPLEGGGIQDDFGWNSSNVVNAILTDGHRLIVGGYFNQAGSTVSPNIAQYDIPSATWSSFGNGTDGEVTAMAVVGDTLWVGRSMSPFLTRIHIPTQTWHPFEHAVVDGPVRAIRSTSAGLFVAGQFTSHSNIRRYFDGQWRSIGGLIKTDAGSYLGSVQSMTETDGFLVVGGDFNQVVQPDLEVGIASNIAKFDLQELRWDTIPGGRLDGTVFSVTAFDDGFVAAGSFKSVGGTIVSRIAKWSPSLGWQSMDGGIDRQNLESNSILVKSLFSHGDELLVGGAFTQVRQVPYQIQAYNVIRWKSTGWSTFGEGLAGNQVRSIAILPGQRDRILVVGDNVSFAGSARLFGIGVWNGEEWSTLRDGLSGQLGLPSPAGFPNTPGNGYQVVTQGDIAFIGGDFGYAHFDQRFEQFVGNGTLENLQYVKTVAPDHEGLLYIGGTRFVEGVPTPFIQKWTGRIWRDLGPIEGSDVTTMAEIGGKLIAAGPFTSLKGIQASYLAQYDPQTQTWSAFGQPNHEVHAIHLTSTSLYVGGQFSQIGGILANNIARYDLSSGTWHSIGDGISETWGSGGRVMAITTLGDLVYVGGLFSRAGTVNADNIARWNGSAWEELGGGTNDAVTALASQPSGRIYLGGYFDRVGQGIHSSKFAIWDQTDRPVSIEDDFGSEIANTLILLPAYPNPFNPSTRIGFQLAQSVEMSLIVYDVLGREVAVLANGRMSAGIHHIDFDASSLASGVYQVVLESDGQRTTRGITLLK